MGFFSKISKAPEQSAEAAQGMGYKTDGRGTRSKVGKGKQRMLLDSTKLLLDNIDDGRTNPFEAEKRVDNNVYQMFNEAPGETKK